MAYAYILFWKEEDKPMRITAQEYVEILAKWKTATHIIVRGDIIHKSDIRRIKAPEKPAPFALPEPEGKPVSAETIQALRKKRLNTHS